jgi:CcmD family protein
MLTILLSQVSPEDITLEMERLQRNYEFLKFGWIAAWVILAVYVLMMVGRQRKLKLEIDRLRTMLGEKSV